ncbi:hypothetical protein M5K25_000064 [Dendrobium thyrsiflorum]|uniref:Uncharacterized protein n=1 Tax=Dendrobium thyrsiflorum TaxID=117978 RepID=A0ABD0VSM2_DENTH
MNEGTRQISKSTLPPPSLPGKADTFPSNLFAGPHLTAAAFPTRSHSRTYRTSANSPPSRSSDQTSSSYTPPAPRGILSAFDVSPRPYGLSPLCSVASPPILSHWPPTPPPPPSPVPRISSFRSTPGIAAAGVFLGSV